MSAVFSEDADSILTRAKHIAHEASHEYVGTEHIFAAMCEIGVPELIEFLNPRGIAVSSIIDKVQEMGRGMSLPADSLHFSPRAKDALCRAIQLTLIPPVTSQRLLYSILEATCDTRRMNGTASLLERLKIPLAEMHSVLMKIGPPDCWPPDSPPHAE